MLCPFFIIYIISWVYVMRYTNNTNIPLPMAVWLLNDEYDYIDMPNYVSATSLLKPIRSLILSKRVPWEDKEVDLSRFVAARLGNAIHDSVEKAWVTKGKELLMRLGFPEAQAEKVIVNPTGKQLKEIKDIIPIYMEQRQIKTFRGYNIGGKFDLVMNGHLYDFKSTSVYSYTKGNNDENYALQGSIYRWLNPDIITEDVLNIQFVFTDWQSFQAKTNPEYPQTRIVGKQFPLLSMRETENYIISRLKLIEKYKDASQDDIPECTPEELWQSAPQYKYYNNPLKTDGRSTRNFDNKEEADEFMKGKPGVLKTILGEPKRCGYCDAYDICKQRERLNV